MGRVTCSSHIPILADLIWASGAKSALEFGAGLYSTSLFVKLCDRVTSIETDLKWYTNISNLLGNKSNKKLMLLHVNEDMVLHYFSNSLVKYDIIFVDTVNKIRKRLVELSTQHTDNIVLHDSQLPQFKDITLEGFKKIVFSKCPIKYKNGTRPFTTLWTRDPVMARYFTMMKEESIYLRNSSIW